MTRFTITPVRSRPRHVGIVGSRHLTDTYYREFCTAIRPLLRPSDVIVSGGADGVDTLARRYARQNRHEFIEHPVNDARVNELMAEHDRTTAYAIAAHERNQLIVDDSDVIMAVKCQHSRGTLDTIKRMRRKLGLGDGQSDAMMRLVVWLWDCNR